MRIFGIVESNEGIAIVTGNLAALAMDREDWRDAEALARDALSLSVEIRRQDLIASHCRRLAIALVRYREALRIARSVSYPEGAATYTGNLAALALDREDWSGAEALAREGLLLSEKLGRQELIALDSQRVALALIQQGKKAEALSHAERAVSIYQTRLSSPPR